MAITILGRPPQIIISASVMPVYNPIVYTVTSDNVAECSFRFICDIYVNGVNVKRLKQFPNQLGNADFKINRVLEDYLTSNPQINITTFVVDPNRVLEYELHFGEEYDSSVNCDALPTVYPDLEITTTDYAWNAAMQYREWADFITPSYISRFVMSPPTKGEFLTPSPDRILIGMGEQAELSFLNLPGYGYTAGGLVVDVYDDAGNFVDTDTLVNSNTTVTDYSTMFQTVGVGPENINNAVGYPIINCSTSYYSVYLVDTASGNLVLNPTFQYLAGPGGSVGENMWDTDAYPGCSTTFGISMANKLQFTMPDVSCGDTLTITYLGGSFSPGASYLVDIVVDNVNNPSGSPQYIQARLGGNVGTAFGGVGTASSVITCGPTGTLELIGYFDADTSGFGSHSFSATSISIIQLGGNRTSEIKTYEIDRRKSRYNPLRFRWLNPLGGFDSYSFNMAKTDMLEIQRTEFDKLNGQFEASLNTWTYNVGDRGRTNTSITAKQKVTATSNWLTQEESDWLSTLYTSVNVNVQETNPIYTFWKMAPNDPDYPDDLPLFFLTCPLTEEFIVNNIDGNMFFVDKSDNTYNFDVEEIVEMGATISTSVLQAQTTLGSPILSDTGIIYLADATLVGLPVIVTSNSFDVKVKARTKNINQTIEFEYAFDKNIQRA